MFTGIIEALGTVSDIRADGSNLTFSIRSTISHELKVDQSVNHNGVCLTVVDISGDEHRVTAIDETLGKSNLGKLRKGDIVNLERSMPNNGRFDGHIVQGHVDTIGTCTSIRDEGGSWLFDFSHAAGADFVTVEKGSIAVNGTSLTCFNSSKDRFRVAIIPYTFEHTNFSTLKAGDTVNLEFDVIGKYVRRMMNAG